jgi:hypothetical protein
MTDDEFERMLDRADYLRDELKDREYEEAFDLGLKKDVGHYISYLNQERVVSKSHVMLHGLWTTYGRTNVDAELERQFNEQGQ